MTRTIRSLIPWIFGFLLIIPAAAAMAQNGNPPGPGGALWTPFAPGCETAVADITGVRMAFSWTGPGYEKVDTMQPGYGYFLIPENPDTELALPDCRMDPKNAPNVTVNLAAGWNLLGNPFSESIEFESGTDASGARAQTFAARAAARAAREVISQGGTAAPGDVVWVYSATQGARSLDTLAQVYTIGTMAITPVRAAGDKRAFFFVTDEIRFTLKTAYKDGRTTDPDPAEAQWSVSDENLARFQSAGVLKPIAPGHVTVTARLDDGLSATLDVMITLECEAVCISAVVKPGAYATTQAYDQFADTLRTEQLGVMPVSAYDCAYMETSGRHDPKPVQTAAVSVVENHADSSLGLRAYCKYTYKDNRGLYTFNEKDPANNQDRTVYLMDITGQAAWSWNNKDVIKKISASGVIESGAKGSASVTAEYKGFKSAPAFVSVQGDTPVSITTAKTGKRGSSGADILYEFLENSAYDGNYDYYNGFDFYDDYYNNYYTIVPWHRIQCSKLPIEGICKSGETASTFIEVLPLGDTGQLTANVRYQSGRTVNDPEGVVWSSDADSVAKVSSDGKITGMGQGRTKVYASLDGVKSSALDVPVAEEKASKFYVVAKLKNGQATGDAIKIRTLINDDVIRAHDPELLTFSLSALTTWKRYKMLTNDDVTWKVTDAGESVSVSPQFTGLAPFKATVTYKGISLPFTVEKEELVPELKAYTQCPGYSCYDYNYSYQNKVQLSKQADGVIYVSQPDKLILAMEARSSSGYTFDLSGKTEWSVTGPDGRTTSGTPKLQALGLYTVSATYNGKTSTLKIEVFETQKKLIVTRADAWKSSDADIKFKSGETFSVMVYECTNPDYLSKGAKTGLAKSTSYLYNSICQQYSGNAIDSRYDIEITSRGVLSYKGKGAVSAGKAGIGGIRAVRDGIESEPFEVEVWEPEDDFAICGTSANQAVWYDPNRGWSSWDDWEWGGSRSGDPESRAIIQTDCKKYKRGSMVKVRWFGQIAPGVARYRVNVCLDLYIKDCAGKVVRTFRREGCERFAGRAASDFSDYTTVFDTVEEWDQKDDTGKSVAPGCYMASSTFNILYEPVVQVTFTIE